MCGGRAAKSTPAGSMTLTTHLLLFAKNLIPKLAGLTLSGDVVF